VVVPILLAGGFAVGLALGRWALLLAVGVGLWIGISEEVEVPGWFLGAAYGLLGVLGVGVLVRRGLASR
jgi:hypothetical protein